MYLGDAWEVLDSLPESSVDSVITDPPYEIGFMNKGWDNTGVAFDRITWEKVLRVLKPGGYLLAFNHSRTFHRMAVAIEDAGFEIRDTIMWLYGSGFPKSMDISKAIDNKYGAEREVIGTKKTRELPNDVPFGQGLIASHANSIAGRKTNGQVEIDITTAATEEAKQWEGWGTALKPAYEPIIMARKPIPTTVADNVLTHGVGGINIDECRVGTEGGTTKSNVVNVGKVKTNFTIGNQNIKNDITEIDGGRFPANVIHDGSEEATSNMWDNETDNDASRYFYTAKASKKDRDEGLQAFQEHSTGDLQGGRKEGSAGSIMPDDGRLNPYAGAGAVRRNTHPTVKPTDLMQYLVRLISPKGATVLDLFMGSGSTGKATMIENQEREANYHFIGIDRTEEYLPIAQARIEFGRNYAEEKPKADGLINENQVSLFEIL